MSANEYSFRKELDTIEQMSESDFTDTRTPWAVISLAGSDAMIAFTVISVSMEYMISGAIEVKFIATDNPTAVYSHRLYFPWYFPKTTSVTTNDYDRAMKGI